VTSAFISAEQDENRELDLQRQQVAEAEVRELLQGIAQRLATIEAKLDHGS
jgi:hypothetical protein